MLTLFFHIAIYKLEADKKLTSEGITNIIKSKISDDKIVCLIQRGIERHFQQDYISSISSIHVLVPQIEAVLRLILQSENLIVTKEERDALMYKELGGLLEMKELSKVYTDDFIEYLRTLLTDIDGMNLRNKLSHGLLEVDDFIHENSFLIINVLLLLVTKKLDCCL